MASKFVSKITAGNNGVLADRAKNLADRAKLEQETLVANKQRSVLELQAKIDNLTDLAPGTTVDLRPGGKDFNPTTWVNDLHNLQVSLVEANVELEIAKKTLTTWFSDEAPTAASAQA